MRNLRGFSAGVSGAIAATSLLYLLVAVLSLSLSFRGTNISPVWPPAGLALAVLLIYGNRVAPGIAIGAFLANYLTGLPVFVSLTIAGGNTIEAITGAYLIRRFAEVNAFEKAADVVTFIFSCMVSTVTSATIGTAAIYLSGLHAGASYGYLWWTWWLGDTVGDVVFAPLILSAWLYGHTLRAHRKIEIFALAAAVAVVGVLVFGPWITIGAALLYLAIPLEVVTAFRLRLLGAAGAATLLSIIAILGTTRGYGPFQQPDLNTSLLLLQIFIGVLTATGLVISAVVTERRKAEQERNDLLSREQSARIRAEENLREKEVLFKELHHRVKNNLQVVTSLLTLQSRTLKDPITFKAFEESRNRIRAMGLIHEKLYSSEDVTKIPFAEYLRALAMELFQLYGLKDSRVQFQLTYASDLSLDLNVAIPLGLIVNELLSNSCKHAFPDGRAGKITVDLQKVPESRIALTISDNGVGISNGNAPRTLGLRIVDILVKQLSGTLETRHSSAGACYLIQFPEKITLDENHDRATI